MTRTREQALSDILATLHEAAGLLADLVAPGEDRSEIVASVQLSDPPRILMTVFDGDTPRVLLDERAQVMTAQ